MAENDSHFCWKRHTRFYFSVKYGIFDVKSTTATLKQRQDTTTNVGKSAQLPQWMSKGKTHKLKPLNVEQKLFNHNN